MADTPRETALRILTRCRKNGAWSEDTIHAELTKSALSEKDAALCSKISMGVLQNTEYLDFYIDAFCTTPVQKLEPKVLDILRLSAYQILFLDKIPPFAAVDEGVELCKRQANAKAAGLVNAVLRRITERKENLPEIPGKGTARYLAVRYSHPLWMIEECIAEYGYAFTEGFLSANNLQAPVFAHENPLRPGAGLPGTPTTLPGCVELERAAGVAETEAFRQGRFYIQDMAARLAAMAGSARPGTVVLDACAAPGGKSIASAMMMEDRGRILSCDIHRKKLRLIEENAERLGISIIETREMDARMPDEDLKGVADLVIADVPCSGLGVIRRKPEIRRKPQEELDRLPRIQQDILEGLAPCVKPGGVLLYSTCTVRKRENEETVEAFLSKYSEFYPESFELPVAGPVESGMVTLWPHIHGTDGFFICKLRKQHD